MENKNTIYNYCHMYNYTSYVYFNKQFIYIYIFYIYLVNSYDPFFITIYTDLHTQHTEFEFFFYSKPNFRISK